MKELQSHMRTSIINLEYFYKRSVVYLDCDACQFCHYSKTELTEYEFNTMYNEYTEPLCEHGHSVHLHSMCGTTE